MTIVQLQTAISVAETGSFSRAAAALFLSQPHVSSSVKSLEQELGFEIFWRTPSGIRLTERGEQFLDHARIIVCHAEQLAELRDRQPPVRFRLAVSSYTPIVTAFRLLCRELQTSPGAVLSLRTLDYPTALRDVFRMKADAAAFLLPGDLNASVKQTCAGYHLKPNLLGKVPLYLNLRKDHPLAGETAPPMEQLAVYPFVDYVAANMADVANSLTERKDRVRFSQRITVDDRRLRCTIVASTDAFSIGCKLPKGYLDSLGLIAYPLDMEPLSLYVICREGEERNQALVRYEELLRRETADI